MRIVFVSILMIFIVNLVGASEKDSTKFFRVKMVGDIMLGTHFPHKAYLPSSPDHLLESVKDELLNADLTFGNLEGCLLDAGPVVKKCKDTLKCYAFKMPENYVGTLSSHGFDLMSVANNHIYDFGLKGAKRTVALLDSVGIAYSGLDFIPTCIKEINGAKFGLLSVAPNKGTVNINDYTLVKRKLEALKENCDFVIVSFHGGAEGAKHQHVTGEREYFYGENRGNVMEFAHLMVDNGADLVIGHGPHVTRAMEVYKGKFIAYSLGNFCTYRRFNLSGPNGIAPIVELELNECGDFVKGEIIPIYQDKQGRVKIDPKKRVIHKIRSLNKEDIKNPSIQVATDGKITYI